MQFDPTLLGGFLTAMQGFSLEISKQKLEGLEIGDSKYFFYRKPEREFYMLARANKKASEKSVENILSVIYSKFYSEYHQILDNFSGNTIAFESFKDILLSMDFSMF